MGARRGRERRKGRRQGEGDEERVISKGRKGEGKGDGERQRDRETEETAKVLAASYSSCQKQGGSVVSRVKMVGSVTIVVEIG